MYQRRVSRSPFGSVTLAASVVGEPHDTVDGTLMLTVGGFPSAVPLPGSVIVYLTISVDVLVLQGTSTATSKFEALKVGPLAFMITGDVVGLRAVYPRVA
jgi:hypothetical protein